MPAETLKREVGVFGATMMGLGSMVGASVFVSIGIAAGIIGPAVMLAIALAAIVATCNALSSAQLAASMPVSGGTYEYGYAYLTPVARFHRRVDVPLRQDGIGGHGGARLRRLPATDSRPCESRGGDCRGGRRGADRIVLMAMPGFRKL